MERSVGDMVVQTKMKPRLLGWGPKYLSSLRGVGGAAGKGHRDRVEGTSKRLTRTRSNGKGEYWWGFVGSGESWFKKRIRDKGRLRKNKRREISDQ